MEQHAKGATPAASAPAPARARHPSGAPARSQGARDARGLSPAAPGPTRIVLLVTRDTKAAESEYLIGALERLDIETDIIDTAMREVPGLTKAELMRRAADDCGCCIQGAIEGGARAIVGLGGGTGSWIAMNAMQTAPFGFPKVMISTLAFDPRDFVSSSDIIVCPSIADIVGLNDTLRRVLDNCAAAVAGMARVARVPDPDAPAHAASHIGVTSLGITDGGVSALRSALEGRGHEVTSFHANGFGGRAFERWTASGAFRGVVDFTTHEINSLLFGGAAPPGADRLTSAALAGVPQVVVPGGLDVLTRGPVASLTPGERERRHYAQNVVFTHLRATGREMKRAAEIIAERLNEASAPVRVVVPMGGFSREGVPGGIVHEASYDRLFVQTLRRRLKSSIPVFEEAMAINDPAFGRSVAAHLDAVLEDADKRAAEMRAGDEALDEAPDDAPAFVSGAALGGGDAGDMAATGPTARPPGSLAVPSPAHRGGQELT